MLTERDCNTCRHHSQTQLDPRCDDCLRSTEDLPLWEAEEVPVMEKSCENCVFESRPFSDPQCFSCLSSGSESVGFLAKGSTPSGRSDGSTADYYVLPEGATQLQDLIAYRNMNAQDGEIFRAIYRKGHCSHSDKLREAKKVLFYAKAEVERLEKYGN